MAGKVENKKLEEYENENYYLLLVVGQVELSSVIIIASREWYFGAINVIW